MKIINLAGFTCDYETQMLILTKYLKTVFENVKYFRKVFTKQILLIPECQIQLQILSSNL